MQNEPRNDELTYAERVTAAGLRGLTDESEMTEHAAEIRLRALSAADDLLTAIRSDRTLTDSEVDTAVRAPVQVLRSDLQAASSALRRLRQITDAGWWIENGDRPIADLLVEAAAPLP